MLNEDNVLDFIGNIIDIFEDLVVINFVLSKGYRSIQR